MSHRSAVSSPRSFVVVGNPPSRRRRRPLGVRIRHAEDLRVYQPGRSHCSDGSRIRRRGPIAISVKRAGMNEMPKTTGTTSLKVSPRYTDKQWNAAFDGREDWDTAINIVEDRIKGRWLDAADKLRDEPNSGFAVFR